MFVTREMFMENSNGTFSAEAAEIGVSPLQWRGFDQFETNLGNGQRMLRVKFAHACSVFEQVAGCVRVTVFND